MYQVALGFRSLAIKTAVFVVLAGVFAWIVGGSIFPGSQVVNLPQFDWNGSTWHARVTGNGRSPALVRWDLVRTDSTGDEFVEDLGIPGKWRQLDWHAQSSARGSIEITTEVDGVLENWTAVPDAGGSIASRRKTDAPIVPTR